MEQILTLCCELYNFCLAERKDCWELGGHSVSWYAQKSRLPELKRLDVRFAQVYSQVLQDVIKRLDKTYAAFFRRIKNGVKAGYPRFKSAKRYDSFTYPQVRIKKGFGLEGGKFNFPKIGKVKIKLHRSIEGKIKTVTIHRQANGWYALFACEVEPKLLPACDEAVGIDLGLESLVTTSEGETFPCPKYMKKAERNIKHLQRQVSRRKKGSNRRMKAVAQLGKAYLHVANQRKDTAHKVARSLADRYGVIAVEDLQIGNMVKNPYLSKSILDAGWGNFIQILTDKAAEAGRQVIKVDPHNTSQLCSRCGAMVKKPLSQRQHVCPECGLSIHRDVNAARNILQRVA